MSVTFTLATTAPLGSVTRPRIRPPVLWAISNAEQKRQKKAARTRVDWNDRMRPPWQRGSCVRNFFFGGSACAENKPCYNRARLEKLPRSVKRKIPIPQAVQGSKNRSDA